MHSSSWLWWWFQRFIHSKLIWFYIWSMCSLCVKDASVALLREKACVKGTSMWPEAKFLGSLHVHSLGEGKKTRISQRPLGLWGAALSTALSTSLVNTASCLSCTGSNFPLIFSAKRLCSLSLCFTSTFRNQKVLFFNSETHRETRENSQNEQAAVGGSGNSLLSTLGTWAEPVGPTETHQGMQIFKSCDLRVAPHPHIHHKKKKISFEK